MCKNDSQSPLDFLAKYDAKDLLAAAILALDCMDKPVAAAHAQRALDALDGDDPASVVT